MFFYFVYILGGDGKLHIQFLEDILALCIRLDGKGTLVGAISHIIDVLVEEVESHRGSIFP